MFAGYYSVASGILTHQREMDVIGNNLVNIQTPGYRADRMLTGSFEEELLTRQGGTTTKVLNENMATTTVVDSVVSLQHSGDTKETGRNLDFAINGEGFFNVVDTEGNSFLTRNGQFDTDEEGYLVLPNMGRVQNESGDIHLESQDVYVDSQGNMVDIAGENMGNIGLVVLSEDSSLKKADNGMFLLEEGTMDYNGNKGIIVQGAIELSNVDMNSELTKLIEVQRSFQSCSTALQTIDSMNRKAVSEIGSL